MRPPCVSSRPLLSLTLLLAVSAWLPPASAAGNPFFEQRARAQQGGQQVVTVQGRILGSQGDDRLLTSISAPRLAAKGIGDLDIVRVHVGGREMVARVMTEQTFRTETGDEESLQHLDADVVCLIGGGRDTDVQVVGLGGGLVSWIKPTGRMHVIIEKVQ